MYKYIYIYIYIYIFFENNIDIWETYGLTYALCIYICLPEDYTVGIDI